MTHVYILESLRDHRYYIGSTNNLTARPKHHFGKFTPSTKRFGTIKLVFSQYFPTLKEARSIERKLKRKDYISNIIRDGFIKMRG